MDTITLLPPHEKSPAKSPAVGSQPTEISAAMHELKNQASTLSIGLAALRFPEDSEELRQSHVAALEAVVGDMSKQIQRLDHWLVEAGLKGKPRALNSTQRREV
jgi:hypothetical protein